MRRTSQGQFRNAVDNIKPDMLTLFSKKKLTRDEWVQAKALVKALYSPAARHAFAQAGFNFNVNTPLHRAVLAENFRLVKLLLDYHADVNAKNHEHDTPLHFAAHAGNARIAEFLLLCGASPYARNHEHFTPYEIARNADIRAMLAPYEGEDVFAKAAEDLRRVKSGFAYGDVRTQEHD